GPEFPTYEPLEAEVVVHDNLGPDADGRIHLPADALGDAIHLEVRCVDPSATTRRTIARPDRPVRTRDLRLAESLDPARHVREDRRLVALPAGATLTIADRATSRLAWVDTVEALHRALVALGGDPELARWEFLGRWGAMTRTERLAAYAAHACHELALFVWFKDRPLFDDAVGPYLANKVHPTFVDRFLRGDDLRPWLAPWRFGRLNAIERALLAQALPDRRATIARTLADAVAIEAPDPDRDARLVEVLLAGGAPPSGGDGEAGDALEQLLEQDDEAPSPSRSGQDAPKLAKRKAAPPRAARAADLDRAEPLFRPAERTREWAEHNWWHQTEADPGPELVRPSRLWRDLAAHDAGPFLSVFAGDAAGSFAASVVALAAIDLPFTAGPRAVAVSGAGATIRTDHHALAAVAELGAVDGPPVGQILVGSSLVRADDPVEWIDGEQREKYVDGELVTGVTYTARVVVTNPTSATERLAALIQLPAGSIAVGGTAPTRTHRTTVPPYGTTSITSSFYLPFPGTFRWYGARITRGEALVAAAPDRTVVAVAGPTTSDPGSWAEVSQRGTLDALVTFLRTANLERIDVERLAHRLRDRAQYDAVVGVLAERLRYDDAVWAYALVHRDRSGVADWLAHRVPTGLGPLDGWGLDPVARGERRHLEYAPLVVARAHRLGPTRVVPNDGLTAHWRALLEWIALTPAPTADDRLEVAQQLFGMDRVDEATAALAQAPRDQVGSRLQHAYVTAYAALVAGDLATAALARVHADHPIDRWRTRFATLVAMIDEATTGRGTEVPGADGRDAVLDGLAGRQGTLTASVRDGQLAIDHRNLDAATVRFHRMDIELLFSRAPFLGAATDRFSVVEPDRGLEVALGPPGRTLVPIPAELRAENLVIEVVSGAVRASVTHLANALAVTIAAGYGQLRVQHASTGAPLPATYVKVYARRSGGEVWFYKDGYTDLRGRFDYATLSTDDLDRVERFALLVAHDEAGATVVEAAPPTR
ncbi:MAG: hypothetical protein ABMB14_09005, partial [Myxococcota bacterium]